MGHVAVAALTPLRPRPRSSPEPESLPHMSAGAACRMSFLFMHIFLLDKDYYLNPSKYTVNHFRRSPRKKMSVAMPIHRRPMARAPLHACLQLGRNRACISQGSLASLPRPPDFEPHRQKNALRAAAVRCAKRGRAAGRMRCCRRTGACHGPGASCDASCGAASG